MSHLPLFPLPVVLFPGADMPLHIFEPRYRQMVSDCLAGDGRFGLLHHDSDEQGPFLGEAGRVGTVARIVHCDPLPDGRSLIMIRGEERFAIRQCPDLQRLYYEAAVVPVADEALPAPAAVLVARRRTLDLLHAVLKSMNEPPDEVPCFNLDEDLSFQLAPMIQIDSRWQQSLLELRDEAYRLERLDAVFQAALDRARWSDEVSELGGPSFSGDEE